MKDFLLSIGFGKNEVEVYLALVEIGTASVLQISKKTKIHRSNIYDALRNLVNEGLVFEIKGEKKLFHARNPEDLIDYLQQKKLELQEIVKEYRTRFPQRTENNSVKLSRGTFALREAIKSFLDTNDEILAYGIPTKAPDVIGPMIEEFHRERAKRGITMKHIYNSDSADRVKYITKFKLTEGKVFPAKYDSNVTTILSEDKLMFFLWGESDNDVIVLEIKNAELVQPYKEYFEVLWKKAKTV